MQMTGTCRHKCTAPYIFNWETMFLSGYYFFLMELVPQGHSPKITGCSCMDVTTYYATSTYHEIGISITLCTKPELFTRFACCQNRCFRWCLRPLGQDYLLAFTNAGDYVSTKTINYLRINKVSAELNFYSPYLILATQNSLVVLQCTLYWQCMKDSAET